MPCNACTVSGPTSASDAVRRPPVSSTVCSTPAVGVKFVGHRQRVDHHGQFGDVQQLGGDQVGGSARRDTEPSCSMVHVSPLALAIAVFGCHLLAGLGGETRVVHAGHPGRRRATVHPVHQATPGQLPDVAADRHVRHAKRVHQVGDLDRSAARDLVQDHLLSLSGQHQLIMTASAADVNKNRTWIAALQPSVSVRIC